MKKIGSILISIFLITIVFSGCGATSKSSEGKSDSEANTIKVGVTAGPHEEIIQKVKEVAKKQGLDVEYTSFNDYVQPNTQLNEKQLDANIYQHEPYLNQFNKDHGMNLVKVGNAVTFPMGIYSSKIKSLNDLKDGDKISLPNDPTNEARALMLLEKGKVIKLKSGVSLKATIKDVAENPKHIQFLEVEAPMVPRSLSDVAVAAINTNYAIQAKLDPNKDAIFQEPKDSPWINIIVARPDNKDAENVKKLIKVYQSDEVKKYIEEHFKGSVIAAF
ncbi:MetQ/NlpA family ABC transporter substrate-binding protein [Clostridium sp. LBM24168]